MMMINRYMPLVDYDQITTSAPGRFILMGEFADLNDGKISNDPNGKNAIAMTIDKRLKVTIKPYKEGRLRLNLTNFDTIREWPTTSIGMNRLISKFGDCLDYNDEILTKLDHLLHKRYYQTPPPPDCPGTDEKPVQGSRQSAPFGSKARQADDATIAFLILYAALGDSYGKSARPPLDIEISSQIPINLGLGSSSAYAVALTAALMKVFRVSAEPYVISNWATQIDKLFHKFSSGLSSSAIIHGGYCYYQNKVKGYGVKHASPIKVMIIDLGEERYPRLVYEHVFDLAKRDSHRIEGCFNNIGEATGTCWRLLNQAKFHPRSIAQFLLSNQEQLEYIGIGHDRFSDIRERAHLLRIWLKQTHCGRTAFVLYDETDMDHQLNEFRDYLKERDIPYEDYDICYSGLQVIKLPR